jgi:DNA replication protein DnaC
MKNITPNPNFVPSAEAANLEAEARERRSRIDTFKPSIRDDEIDMSRVVQMGAALAPGVSLLSSLEKRMKEFFDSVREHLKGQPASVPCEIHADVMCPVDFDATCGATREQESGFRVVYAACPACARAEHDRGVRAFWTKRGVPSRVIEATFRSYRTDGDRSEQKRAVVDDVQRWLMKRTGFLLLLGKPGTGKGHLAASCLRSNGDGLWIEHVNLLADLRTSYTLKTTDALVASWQDAEMLVLDEFGLSSGGADEEPVLYQVLADRYDKRRPTIITSNLETVTVREKLGFRLTDRIREDLTQVTMNWDSFRTTTNAI